jgi:hypothetical protein
MGIFIFISTYYLDAVFRSLLCKARVEVCSYSPEVSFFSGSSYSEINLSPHRILSAIVFRYKKNRRFVRKISVALWGRAAEYGLAGEYGAGMPGAP